MAITHVFNLSLKNGKFPDSLKKARIVPIHKNGDKNETSNYSPVSILPAISKIIEKLLHKRIFEFFNDQKFFSTVNTASDLRVTHRRHQQK